MKSTGYGYSYCDICTPLGDLNYPMWSWTRVGEELHGWIVFSVAPSQFIKGRLGQCVGCYNVDLNMYLVLALFLGKLSLTSPYRKKY